MKTLIVRQFQEKEFLLASEAVSWLRLNYGINASAETIRNSLKMAGIFSHKKLEKPALTDIYIKKRKTFLRSYLSGTFLILKKLFSLMNLNLIYTEQIVH